MAMEWKIPIDASIGQLDAESDEEFLKKAYVEHSSEQIFRNFGDARKILIGRTGAGKTAILKKLEADLRDHCRRIDPRLVSFEHLLNSNAIQWLIDNNFHIDTFLDIVWNHIILTEIIEIYFQKRSRFDAVMSSLSIGAKRPIETYANRFGENLFIDRDATLVEVSKGVISQISSSARVEFGFDPSTIGLTGGGQFELNDDSKQHLQQRLKNAVPAEILRLQNQARDALKTETNKSDKGYYILIDDLDENFVYPELKMQLLSSLIRVVKRYSGFDRLKICVVMRVDLYRSVFREMEGDSTLIEKMDGKTWHLRWNSELLRRIVDKRLQIAFQDETGDMSGRRFDDIFSVRVHGRHAPFKYMLDRTMMRPRDIIHFVNDCLRKAEGQSKITSQNIVEAEQIYASKRLEFLINEWIQAKPYIGTLVEGLSNSDQFCKLSDLADFLVQNEVAEELWLEHHNALPKFKIGRLVKRIVEENAAEKLEFAKACVVEFFEIGIMQVKMGQWLNPLEDSLLEAKLNERTQLFFSHLCVKPLHLRVDRGS